MQLILYLYDVINKKNDVIQVDTFISNSQEVLEKKLFEVFKKIKYDAFKKAYFFAGGKAKQERFKMIDKIYLTNSNLNKDESIKPICQGMRKMEDIIYETTIYFENSENAEVYVAKEGQNPILFRIKMPSSPLPNKKTGESVSEIGRKIYRCVEINEKHEIEFLENQLFENKQEKLLDINASFLSKLQSNAKMAIVRRMARHLISISKKKNVILHEFALKMGVQYHRIKIIKDKNSDNFLIVKSNKAQNEIKINIKDIFPKTISIDKDDKFENNSLLRIYVKSHIAFHFQKKILIKCSKRRI